MSFSINNKLSFIDSFQFLSSSLDSLVENLNKDNRKYLNQEFHNNVFDLVKRKEFYPYEYMTDFEKFKEKTDRKIIKKEYEHIINVRKKFEIKTMKDYHDLYLKCDSLLLSDVFENFRNNSLKNYGLCLRHYLSAPGLSWNAMLKMTKIKLELITDPDLYILFEKGTRGGISYISNRCSKVNCKYLKYYDLKQESKHMIYLDANNLYGHGMSKFLPTSEFKWIDPKEFDLNKYSNIVRKDMFLKLILNTDYTMIIH